MSHRWILCWLFAPLIALPGIAQSVISAHSGLVHVVDGSVFLDDERVEQKTGKYDQMKNGSELRTQDGRAELLLTPATFLRVGPNSAIRMISNQLDDTRVELLSGSAVVDQSSETVANTSVSILYNLDRIHIQKPGRYRVDSEPPQVRVESGSVQVTAGGKSIDVGAGYVVALEGNLAARKLMKDSNSTTADSSSPGDDLDRWNSARDNSVAENNLDAAATSDLAGVIDGWQNNPDVILQSLGIPPYIPGMSSVLPPVGYGSSLYNSGLYGSGLYNSGLYWSSLYGPGLPPYGFGAVSPVFTYPPTIYRPYRPLSPIYGYRAPAGTHGGYGGMRSVAPVRAPAGVGRPGGGAVHAGGHR